MAAIEQDVYREVQKMVDNFSMGFPETESGIEIKILKKLFSEDDAKVFLKLSPMLEDVATISGKLGLSEDKAGEKLEDMADRGLAFRFRKGDKTYYAAIPFVHGLFEFQVDRLDRELAELVEQYMIDKFNVNMKENAAGFLRPIPVNQSVDASMNIASYEDVEQILKSKDLIVATDCICRKRAKLVEGGCDKPLEACFMFGSMGQYYLDRDMGRKIDAHEALRIVKQCQDAGLVTQPASAQNPGGMCNCCGDCCGVLIAIKAHPKPAEAVLSNYYATIDQEECVGCEECLDRCQVDAIKMNDDGKAKVDLDRCIGCGLCVTTCSTESISLKAKDEKEMKVPAKDSMEQMLNMAKKRGIL